MYLRFLAHRPVIELDHSPDCLASWISPWEYVGISAFLLVLASLKVAASSSSYAIGERLHVSFEVAYFFYKKYKIGLCKCKLISF
jgi:hypothetical protein